MKQRSNAAKVPPTFSDTIRCPCCMQFVRLTERGRVAREYLEKWAHRDTQGRPCPGWVGMNQRVQA